jgi:hypothetical protein
LDHAVVKLPLSSVSATIILDPSYGTAFGDEYNGTTLVRTAEKKWEDESVEKLIFWDGLSLEDPDGVDNPASTKDLQFSP